MFDKVISIGSQSIGVGHPCFVVAEVGINHNGDMNLAHKTIDAAISAGANGVKFQNYATEDFLENATLTYTYYNDGQKIIESQWDMFKRCELSEEELIELKKHCDQKNIIFFSTPTSPSGLNLLKRLNVPLLKNGSDFLTHLNFIRLMAESRIPTILSTGMATAGEIDDAVLAFREAGGKALVLLHCTSSYPTPAQDINLRRIPTLFHTFGCLAGFSDHSVGVTAAVGSVILGSCLIEKHFTFDRSLQGPDHSFSSNPHEFHQLVQAVRDIEVSLGNSQLGVTKSENEGRRNFRLSCQATVGLKAGTRLSSEHIGCRRPGTGFPPKYRDQLSGLVLKRDVLRGHIFTWKDFNE